MYIFIRPVRSVLLGIYFTTTHPNILSVAVGTEGEPYVSCSLTTEQWQKERQEDYPMTDVYAADVGQSSCLSFPSLNFVIKNIAGTYP